MVAVHRVSRHCVMTFMVAYYRVVYEKDLRPDSVNIIKKMERYNPG